MSKSISSQFSKNKEKNNVCQNIMSESSVPLAIYKIFYISERMLSKETEKLNLERFYHPGKGRLALFVIKEDGQIMEILEFAEARRSWLINSELCSNGHIYFTTPIDVTFLALHHLRKHCLKRALALDSIHDEDDPSVSKILNEFVDPKSLNCVADVKTVDGDGEMSFYKYNHAKAIAWLSLKTKRIAKALQSNGVYCGNSAMSQNFARSEKAIDETAKDTDYLRMACDYVGGYIALDLHEELTKHLKITSEIQAIVEEKNLSGKRKSVDKLNASTKKQKLENGLNLLDKSLDEENEVNTSLNEKINSKPQSTITVMPLKERSLSTKEKSLAKSAKGTKSIASFFTKKTA